VHPLLFLALGSAGVILLARRGAASELPVTAEPFTPPSHPAEGELVSIDPGIDQHHQIGELPCPRNPPPPAGYQYLRSAVTPELTAFATRVLHDASNYPIGSFVQTTVSGEEIAARVEWHPEQGATGRRGCFRGVSLMEPI
jgi:hypothetical protein